MSDTNPSGTDWTDSEIDLIVADYFEMLRLELAGSAFVKSHRNAALQQLIGRSRGSIEFKHQNISAVLVKLGLPWIEGYKPLPNYQHSLIDGIERFLGTHETAIVFQSVGVSTHDVVAANELDEPEGLFIDSPPQVTEADVSVPTSLTRLVKKFDPAARDQRNRALGRRGEARVAAYEKFRLRQAGRRDLAEKVRWISDLEGDGAGYDILSFNNNGSERLLEVKTTVGHAKTPFFLSENERALSTERPDAFRILRLYDFARTPRAFELAPPLESCLILKATNYRASFEQ